MGLGGCVVGGSVGGWVGGWVGGEGEQAVVYVNESGDTLSLVTWYLLGIDGICKEAAGGGGCTRYSCMAVVV